MAARPSSASRRAQQRRVNRATAGLAIAAATATAIFGLAAAHATRVATGSSGNDDLGAVPSGADDFGSSSLTPSQSAPTQSFGPPAARSGGS